jgi:hypothetical protein
MMEGSGSKALTNGSGFQKNCGSGSGTLLKINTFSTLHAGFLGVEKRKKLLTL